MTEIKVEGTITLEDKEAREWLKSLNTKIEAINERTKTHTIDIQKLKKSIKK
ncbi:hypothetical protein LCGC14_0737810 [marine sediment metagenome]|uniref:Uncharacterized protein n=1 Tax=marine sediment metagenome TaxID=412755 RepID=A0A0F9Q7N2_9ZZZZ